MIVYQFLNLPVHFLIQIIIIMFAIVDQVATGLNVPVDLLKVFIALLTSFFLSTLHLTLRSALPCVPISGGTQPLEHNHRFFLPVLHHLRMVFLHPRECGAPILPDEGNLPSV